MTAESVSQLTCPEHKCAAYFIDLDAYAHDEMSLCDGAETCNICIARTSRTCAACVQSDLETRGLVTPFDPDTLGTEFGV